MPTIKIEKLAHSLAPTAFAAGRIELEFFHQDIQVSVKKDGSPVTRADRLAEAIIVADLAKIAPDIPVIAEEAASDGKTPTVGEIFFLVDPLDGTKEFIKKSPEFTVNIALVEHGQPVFGLVYAPALKQMYITLGANKAVMATIDPKLDPTSLNQLSLQKMFPRKANRQTPVIVASKSHITVQTKEFIDQYNDADLQSVGSSLKFCMLARGDADLYPRFGPTKEWDTAAGQAILQAAGGKVETLDGHPLSYGKVKANYENPFFIASSRPELEFNMKPRP